MIRQTVNPARILPVGSDRTEYQTHVIPSTGSGFPPVQLVPRRGNNERKRVTLSTPNKVIYLSDDSTPILSNQFVSSFGYFRTLVGNQALGTPDAASLDILGDIEIILRFQLPSWTNGIPGSTALVSKWVDAVDRSYMLLFVGNQLALFTSATGAAFVQNVPVTVPLLPNETAWLRATLDVDDGAGNRVYNFFTAPDSESVPTTWTLFNSQTIAGVTSIFNSVSGLGIASYGPGGFITATGAVKNVILRNGIGGPIVFQTGGADMAPLPYVATTGQTISAIGPGSPPTFIPATGSPTGTGCIAPAQYIHETGSPLYALALSNDPATTATVTAATESFYTE